MQPCYDTSMKQKNMTHKLLANIDANGLTVLGAFTRNDWQDYCARHSCADDLPKGDVFVIIASIGASFWKQFTNAMPDTANPFDDYSKQVLHQITHHHGADIYHPSDKPYLPFQHYCLMLNDIYGIPLFHRSPLGILFHQHYGLWYGLRGLLALGDIADDDMQEWQTAIKPLAINDGVGHNDCVNCENQPCVASCPAGAVQNNSFNVAKCSAYIVDMPNRCTNSCVARDACPYGSRHRYPNQKLTYLMRTRIKNATG